MLGSISNSHEKSMELGARAEKVLAGGVNSNFRFGAAGRFWESGHGARITDSEGREYVDYALGMGTAILGHSAPAVLEKVALAQQEIQCPAGQHAAEVELAERLVELVPSAELVRIGCTGSEMVQLALRLARAATKRSLIVKFQGHYHGWFDSIYAGTAGAPIEDRLWPGLPQSAGQLPGALADLAVLPWNDLPLLEEFFKAHGAEVAGVIMEPVGCNTSVIAPRAGYLEGVRSLCDEHGAVLIFDEVITGFRLSPSGAQGRLGVTPDLTVLGKALGAGFPIAALVGRERLMRLVADGTVMHGGTYNANAMAINAALAALDVLCAPRQQIYAQLETTADLLADGLTQLAKQHGGAMNVQRFGPVMNTTFDPPEPIVDYRSYQASDLERQKTFIRLMDEERVRITSRGTWFLSTEHGRAELDFTLNAADRALSRLGSA